MSGHSWSNLPMALITKWVNVGRPSFGRDSISFKTLSTLTWNLTMATPSEGGVQVPSMIFFLIETYFAPGKKLAIAKYAPITSKK